MKHRLVHPWMAAALGAATLCGCGSAAAVSTPAVPTLTATNSPSPMAATTPDPTVAWATVINNAGRFSLRYPGTLRVTYNCAAEVWLDQTSAAGQQCPLVGDTGELLLFFQSAVGDQRDRVGRNDGSFPSEGTAPLGPGTAVTVDGVSGMRYTGTWAAGGQGIVAGEKQIVYAVYANGRTYAAIYSQNAGTPDMTADFTLMVEHTLKLTG